MDNKIDGKQEQRNEHSLPGTNQAGKPAAARDEKDEEDRTGGKGARQQGQLEKHSLPGTNQAGKGPAKPDADAT